MPPMSAWCAMLHMKQTSLPSANTGIAMFTSGRCDPPAAYGSFEMKMSPSFTSESGILASSAVIRPIIEPMWIASEFSAWTISRPVGSTIAVEWS
jgi:hypothetical protein